MQQAAPERFLRLSQVADILQISRTAAYRLAQSGELPSIRFGEKMVRVRQADFDAFLASSRVPAKSASQSQEGISDV